jgi:KUP system potassium uptake protein
LFGPVVSVYFTTIAVLGGLSVAQHPDILLALNPYWAINFFIIDQWLAFLALGSVVLAVTGTEALYTDMGHFGRRPIRNGWWMFVMPALMLNYMGQGALLIDDPSDGQQPVLPARSGVVPAAAGVHRDARDDRRQPGGDFGRLLGDPAGDAARLHSAPLHHPHQRQGGRPDLHPAVNNFLMVMVILLVLVFQNSSNLAAAYGVAVTGAMLIDTFLLAVVLFPAVEMAALASLAAAFDLLRRRFHLFRREPDEGPQRRLVPASDRPHRLHLAHHLGARPQADDGSDGRGRDPDARVHQVGRSSATRVPAPPSS